MPSYREPTITPPVPSTPNNQYVMPDGPKHPHVAKQRYKEGMTAAQKQGVDTWNSLIECLQYYGLMEDKK
jgi:hypothetical protein